MTRKVLPVGQKMKVYYWNIFDTMVPSSDLPFYQGVIVTF